MRLCRALLKILAEYKIDEGVKSLCEYWKTTLEAIVAIKMRDDGCLDHNGAIGDRNTWI